MIILVAFRNLTNNLKHSLLICSLLAILISLFFLGNTFLYTSYEGLRQTYILNYTGDLVIMPKSDVPLSLFGASTPAIGEFFTIPMLNDYPQLKNILDGMSELEAYTAQLSGPVAMDLLGRRSAVFGFGIDAQSYFKVFPGIRLIAGERLLPKSYGIMISEGLALRLETETGKKVTPGQPVLLTTASTSGFRIREVPLVGIYRYEVSSPIPDEVVILDMQTLRALNAILLVQTNAPKPISNQTTAELEDIFNQPVSDTVVTDTEGLSLYDLAQKLKQTSNADETDWSWGSFNFIILRLKAGISKAYFIEKLQKQLEGLDAVVVDWTTAAGTPALLVTILYYLFNGGLVFLMLAGLFAIINVMLITVFQRVREIGTLRAIGASKNYIRLLLLTENFLIALGGGIGGVTMGCLSIMLINLARIRISNSLIQTLLAKGEVVLSFSWEVAILSLGVAVFLSLSSSVYPLSYALRIQPITAVRKG